MRFYIHEDNLERLHKKIDRIRRKCVKYGCDFHYEEVGEEFKEHVDEESGYVSVSRYIVVECEGTAKVNGWKFAATIDHTEKGNILRKFLSDVEIPERYRDAEPECEHCHSRRHRKDTYLVYNEETKEFKQVGSSCLCDFTNGFSAEAAASYIALFDSLMEFESPIGGWSGSTRWFEVPVLLRYAVDYVNHLGYASTRWPDGEYNDECTKAKVLRGLDYDVKRATKYEREDVELYREKFGNHVNDEDTIEEVEKILEFIRTNEEDNDFMHNLKVLADTDYIDYRNVGYVVAMVPTYNRHIEKVTEKARRDSELQKEIEGSKYLGEVGQRITVKLADVTTVTWWDTQFGSTIRYKMKDEDGNVLMWDCSSYIDSGQEVESITGTIKKLDEFRGVKQTWLTRCRVKYA